tara:strand:+ start:251 stop:448 length:198 start_codon:yes stop_codon:yes gene_type:complete
MNEPMNATDLLSELDKLEERKAETIAALIEERETLISGTAARVKSIGLQLRALSYKRPRKATKKA